MLALLDEIVRWIGPLFASAGYVLIAVAVFLERSVFLGLVVPGDVVLALGGIYAARDRLSFAAVAAVATVAAAGGESAGYWLGRRYGTSLIARLPVVRRLQKRFDDAERYFDEHGGKTVAIGRFATAAGSFVPFAAGVARMPYARFLLFDLPAVVVWATGIAAVGYLFGRNLERVEGILARFGWVMLAALASIVVARSVRKRRRKARETGRR